MAFAFLFFRSESKSGEMSPLNTSKNCWEPLLFKGKDARGSWQRADNSFSPVQNIVVDSISCFCNYRNMRSTQDKKLSDRIPKYADMLSAMGTEPRLRIMRMLLSAHPEGLVVSDIQEELDIPNSTLSHHLDKLKNEDLVRVQRESTFLRYSANTKSLQELLSFLYSECCTRNQAVRPESIVQISR